MVLAFSSRDYGSTGDDSTGVWISCGVVCWKLRESMRMTAGFGWGSGESSLGFFFVCVCVYISVSMI